MFNPQGTLHGGIITTIMDISMGHLIKNEQSGGIITTIMDISMGHLIKNEQSAGTTLELKVNFMSAIKHEKIKCIGSFLKKGRTISTLDSQLFREDGKLAAYATSTWKIL